MDTLLLTANQSGYTMQPPNDVLRVQLDGGAGRYRRNILNGTSIVNVSWNCDQVQYDYFWAFYRAKLARGSVKFLTNLILEFSDISIQYVVQIVPGTLSLSNVEALNYTITAQLEVTPNAYDSDFDNSLVDVYTAYGESSSDVLADIAHLVNEQMTALHV